MCGIIRADGESALATIAEFDPTALFFDFDRTLATTRTGASPLKGKGKMVHSVEPSLAAAARSHTNVHVVTRNNHFADICTFLKSHGLGHIKVHCVKLVEKVDKAAVISELLGEDETGVFVDDSFQEVLHPTMRKLVQERRGRLRTVLFAKGL